MIDLYLGDDVTSLMAINSIPLHDDDVDSSLMVTTPFSGCWKQQDHEDEFTRGRTHQDMALFHHEGFHH